MTKRALPAPEDKARAVRSMFDTIANRYDLVNRVMTFGMDVRWRRRLVDELHLPPGATVLDLACGTGDFVKELVRAGHRPIGMDFALEMLRASHVSAPLVQADILHLPVPDASVDGITCGFALRNVVDLEALFAEMARVVRPGGRVGLLEVAEPVGRFTRVGHRVYFNKVVPLIGGILSDRDAYEYLPASVAYLPPPREIVRMMIEAGFGRTARAVTGLGAAQMIAGTRS